VPLEVDTKLRPPPLVLRELLLRRHVLREHLTLLELAREGKLERDESRAPHERYQHLGHFNAERRLVILDDAADSTFGRGERRVEHVRELLRVLCALLPVTAVEATCLVVCAVRAGDQFAVRL